MNGIRLLFLSHSHPFGAFRVGSHHYARTLARGGAEVVHLSTPISLAHRVTGRVSAAALADVPRGVSRDDSGVQWLVPRTVLPRPYGRFRADRALRRAGVSPAFDAVLIDQPLLWDASVRSLAPVLVYRPTDLYPDEVSGVKARLQRSILAAADGVIATSDEVLRGLGSFGGVKSSLVLPNGVEHGRFGGGAGGAVGAVGALGAVAGTAPRPAVCVYVGAFDGRFDWGQVRSWATAMPDVRFVIAGPVTGAPGDLPVNVEVIGPVAYEALPALLQGARVGLLPLSDDPLNAGRSPMKLYEYLAAGLAVVARETPVLRGEPNVGLFTYVGASGADSISALRKALAFASPNVAGVARAAAESWDAKAERLLEFVRGLSSSR